MENNEIILLLFLFLELKMSKDLVAPVTGYTGESGKALLHELIKSNQFKKIILVGRRQVDYTDNEYKEKTVLHVLHNQTPDFLYSKK